VKISPVSNAGGRVLGVTSANWLDPPYNRWGFRHVPDLVTTARIPRGDGPARDLPRAERDLDGFTFEHAGRRFTLAEMLAETYTDGFLVLQDGAIVTERYLDGFLQTDTHLLMSCSKSLTSVLCGVLAGRGLVAPHDPVTRHLPELAGTAWEGCRLQDILDMRVGIAWNGDADEYLLDDVSDYRTHDRHGTIPADTETWIRTIARGPLEHGSGPFRYCSLAIDVLGWVLARAGGAPFPELFSRELWSRLGAEQDAHLMLDHSGFALVEGGICTSLRDLGRFGLLCLQDGRVGEAQIVPADWLARVRVRDPELIGAFRAGEPDPDPTAPEAFYHDAWWVDDGPRGVFAARGRNGQWLLIHRPSRVVMVQFSTIADPLDPERYALQRAGMLALCDHLA